MKNSRQIKVLIVDDSALMRELLTSILEKDPEISVIDTAADPLIAREKIKKHNPDVLTLDVEMPRMNGIDFLAKLMSLRPMPVIMFSSLTQQGADTTIRALELGAVDAIGKPLGFVSEGMSALEVELIAKVKAAAKSKVRARLSADKVPTKNIINSDLTFKNMVIALGASTGGVPVIGTILEAMPQNCPPILITQHMPAGFTGRFAVRVNETCAISVQEARHGMRLQAGHAYIAPGGFQMRLKHFGGERRLEVVKDERVNGFCPSVDVLFQSVAEHEGKSAIGALLTGMGADGAQGLLRMKKAGAFTIGQDEASCVVFGMPKAALELDAINLILPSDKIAKSILERASVNFQAAA